MIWPESSETISFPGTQWGYQPLCEWPHNWAQTDQLCKGRMAQYRFNGVIVCKNCEKNATVPFRQLKHPGKEIQSNSIKHTTLKQLLGDIPRNIKALNYGEKCFLFLDQNDQKVY